VRKAVFLVFSAPLNHTQPTTLPVLQLPHSHTHHHPHPLLIHSMETNNVFVKYLPEYINDSSLRELFSPFGNVISAKVMVDHVTGTTLGYGYVCDY
jgi:RNA recognition motif-containing protein